MPEQKKGTGAGSIWTWIAIDADSKLVLSYLCGGRDAEWAKKFMGDLASRVSTRIQITTDGHRAYAEAVEGAFGMEVDYAMLIKLYGAPSDRPDTRYSPAECIGIRTGVLNGSPDPQHISTSFVERQNLNLRMGVRRFTRLTTRSQRNSRITARWWRSTMLITISAACIRPCALRERWNLALRITCGHWKS